MIQDWVINLRQEWQGVGGGEKGLTLPLGDDGISVFLHHLVILLYQTKPTESKEQDLMRGEAVRPSLQQPLPFTLPRLLQWTAREQSVNEQILCSTEMVNAVFTHWNWDLWVYPTSYNCQWLIPRINVWLFLWIHWPLDLSASLFQEAFYVE